MSLRGSTMYTGASSGTRAAKSVGGGRGFEARILSGPFRSRNCIRQKKWANNKVDAFRHAVAYRFWIVWPTLSLIVPSFNRVGSFKNWRSSRASVDVLCFDVFRGLGNIRPNCVNLSSTAQFGSSILRNLEILRPSPSDLRQAQLQPTLYPFKSLSFLSMSFRFNFVFNELGAKTCEQCMELCAVYSKSQQWYRKHRIQDQLIDST